MTALSLFYASTGNPGQPNQALTPEDVLPPPDDTEKHSQKRHAKRDRRRDRPVPIAPPPAGIDQDDIPLRLLRNAQWVNSRIGKDRPSPLPLHLARQTQHHTGEETPSETATSPFPIGLNPLMPASAQDAGEDLPKRDDMSRDSSAGAPRAHVHERYDQVGQATGDEAELRLLPDEDRTRRRSVMAKSNDGGPRWCRKCEAWKPDRTHHCRYCKRCTLKSESLRIAQIMSSQAVDHHCAWLGTCVGFHNCKPPPSVPRRILLTIRQAVSALHHVRHSARHLQHARGQL